MSIEKDTKTRIELISMSLFVLNFSVFTLLSVFHMCFEINWKIKRERCTVKNNNKNEKKYYWFNLKIKTDGSIIE